MSKSSTQPTRAGGTRSSQRRSEVSPLDNIDDIRRKASFLDAGVAAEYMHARGYIPSKEVKELDVIAVSNALYGVASFAQGKDLLEGIQALAAILTGIHVEQTAQALAAKLAETAAERLKEEIEAQMTNLEKQLEEKTSIVLSMVDQAHDKIRQATSTLENATNRLDTADIPRHTSSSSPDAQNTAQTYAAVVHSHLPTTHPSNLARQQAQRRRILLDSNSDATHNLKDLSEAQIVAKANLALEQMNKSTQPAGKFTGARILRNGGVVIEANEEGLAIWVQDSEQREEFQDAFDGGQAQIKEKLYAVIIEFVPIAHKTGNTTEYRHIEGVSQLNPGQLVSTKWMKPIERRSESQRTAHILAKFRSARAANAAIRDGIIVVGKLVYGRKPQQEPRRCMKCQQIGPHFAAHCQQDGETCGTCGKTHATKECTEQNPDH